MAGWKKRVWRAAAVSPIRSSDTDYLTEAWEKGIAVVSYDTPIVSDKVPYIGIDNRKAGQELAKAMAKQLGNTGQVGIVTGDLQQESHAERMEGILSYIKEHTGIEVAFVESGYSNRVMEETKITELGTGFSGYLLELRMECAKGLLQSTNDKIKDVAAKSGFNDYHYFSKAFKKMQGLSPADYRKQTKHI